MEEKRAEERKKRRERRPISVKERVEKAGPKQRVLWSQEKTKEEGEG